MTQAAATRVYIATPAHQCLVSADFVTSLLKATRIDLAGRGAEFVCEFMGNESHITRARNIMVERFMRTNCTHLMFIDSDIVFPPDSIWRLIQHDVPIVAGIYPRKSLDFEKMLTETNVPPAHRGLSYNFNTDAETRVSPRGLAVVKDLATGFMLIRRDAIEKLRSAHPELLSANDTGRDIDKYYAIMDSMRDKDDNRWLSEDFAFCRRWQELGGSIVADVSIPLTHVGTLSIPFKPIGFERNPSQSATVTEVPTARKIWWLCVATDLNQFGMELCHTVLNSRFDQVKNVGWHVSCVTSKNYDLTKIAAEAGDDDVVIINRYDAASAEFVGKCAERLVVERPDVPIVASHRLTEPQWEGEMFPMWPPSSAALADGRYQIDFDSRVPFACFGATVHVLRRLLEKRERQVEVRCDPDLAQMKMTNFAYYFQGIGPGRHHNA